MTQFYHFKSSSPIATLPEPLPYKVLIATPTTRDLVPSYVVSLAATVETLVHFGVAFEVGILDGDCHVDDVRNRMIRDFLDGDCTDLLFIDSDLGWQSRNVMRLLQADGDIVAGVYRLKTDEESYPFHPGVGVREANADGLFTMPKAATGFMRIRRHVLEALYAREKEAGRFTFAKKDASPNPICRIVERAFAKELKLSVDTGDGADYHSGDYVLCLKARHMGFSVLVDVEMAFEHVGSKSWIGHCGNFLRAEKGIDHPDFVAAIERLKAGDDSLETFEALVRCSGDTFAMTPEGQQRLYHLARASKGPVLECGSGVSTLVLGAAMTDGEAWVLEHNLLYLRQTMRRLNQYGLGERIRLTYAPMVPHDGGDWYGIDPSEFATDFDLVLLDGPKRSEGNRDLLFTVLRDSIANADTWLIDDCVNEVAIRAQMPDRQLDFLAGYDGEPRICIASRRANELIMAAE
jgi:hypothetical protein